MNVVIMRLNRTIVAIYFFIEVGPPNNFIALNVQDTSFAITDLCLTGFLPWISSYTCAK